MLFQNRDKFDCVVLYDSLSEGYDTTGPLSSFVRVVYEMAFTKMLRNPPMLLIGGLQAWKKCTEGGATVGVFAGQLQASESIPENGVASGLATAPSLASPAPDTSQPQSTLIQPAVNCVTLANSSPERRPLDMPQLPRYAFFCSGYLLVLTETQVST